MSALFSVALRAVALSFLILSLPVSAETSDSPEDFEISPLFDVVRPSGAGNARLVLRGADQVDYAFEFAADEAVALTDAMIARARMKNGLYRWNATFQPVLDDAARALLQASRTDPSIPAPDVGVPSRSGSVRLIDGGFLVSLIDPERGPGDGASTRDQIIADDLIVQFSACIGMDCVNGESFGSDTLRLKENNLRIHFDDTSNSASFPANDWRLTANGSNNGDPSYFSIDDATAGRSLLYLEAGARANSIYADNNGTVGFGTNLPVGGLGLHLVTGNTPALRLDQDGSSGFASQAWDLAGNETNFFVRDTTNGSLLPFRIRPGAPTSSLDIASSGRIGMGIASPTAAVHVRRNAVFADEWLRIDLPDDMDPATEERKMVLDNAGNLFVGGAITQLSSRYSKENLLAVAGDQVLEKLAELPLWTWNYLTANDGDRHIGPVAEDFYRTFGFGESERSLSPSDVAGVALAASQALNRSLNEEIEQRDQRIDELEARLARLETMLLAEETVVDAER
jgi:hypothetical protein